MKDVVDVLARLNERAGTGSKSDRKLARLILDDPDFALRAPIADLAVKAGISEPTVTRFCRGLGCEGTRDFKYKLAQAIAVGEIFLRPQQPRAREQERLVSLVTDAAMAAIEHMRAGLDMAAIERMSETIVGTSQVLIFGSGGASSMMAVELQNRLFRFRIKAVAYVDGQMQRMAAALAGPGTCVIAFSTSGHAPLVVDSVNVARQYGATTMAVTQAGSPLARAAEIVLPYQTLEDGNIYKPTSSRYALLAVVDILATSVAERIGPAIAEGLRRIRHGLVTLQIEDPRMPLGD